MKILHLIVCAITLSALLGCGQKTGDAAIEVGLVCSALEKSLFFYRDIIGMKESGGFEVDGQFGLDSGFSDGKTFTVKLLKLDGCSTILKLACCSAADSLPKPTYAQDRAGLQYLTLEVKSTRAIKERLGKNGIRMLGKTPLEMSSDTELILVQDPDGVFVEIIGGKN